MAPTIETAAGLVWMTGYRDAPPLTPRGPCDAVAGLHAAFATVAAVCERDESGRGHELEVSMVEAALNVAAEVSIEYSAYGASLGRDGNRGPTSAPQGVYACDGDDAWIALAVADDDHWQQLRSALGDPQWAREQALATAAGRREHHDAIDAHLAAWTRERTPNDAVATLIASGVPAAVVTDGLALGANEQLRARGYFEPIENALIGRHEVSSLPYRFASRTEPWVRSAAPTLGQHNREVLGTLLGLDAGELDDLETAGITGTVPLGL